MGTFASDLLPDIWEIRATPGELGCRIHSVTLVAGDWSGAHTGDGTETTTETNIYESGSKSPKVRWKTSEELAVGNLARGTCEIGPITPSFSGGGTVFSIFSTATAGDTLKVKITGPQHPLGALYRITDVEQQTPFRIMLTASPVAEK